MVRSICTDPSQLEALGEVSFVPTPLVQDTGDFEDLEEFMNAPSEGSEQTSKIEK